MQLLSSAFKALKPRLDDDFVDRLNYFYTPCLLLMLGVLVSASQWVGDPIECWVPPQFNKAWEEYTENYCFVRSTYYVSLLYPPPASLNLREEKQLSYYQWVPFILGLMTLCFSIPYLVFWILNSQTGVFVSIVDLFAKFLYIVNTLGQLLFLNKAFGTGDRAAWGFDIFRFSVQCVLIINMFNEKIFLFLWCWSFLLLLLNFSNFFYWLSLSMNPDERLKYTRKLIGNHIEDDAEDTKLHRAFTFRFLKPDGILVLRKLTIQAGDIVGAKILRCLFDDFRATVAAKKVSVPAIGFYDEETRELDDSSDDGNCSWLFIAYLLLAPSGFFLAIPVAHAI